MKGAIFLVAALTALGQAQPANLSGTWDAVYAGPRGYDPQWPKPLHGDIPTLLHLRVSGDRITGTAVVDSWPGRSDISDGKVEGDQFSFRLTGRSPARSTYQGVETIHYPVMYVTGTVGGDEIAYTFTFGRFQAAMRGHRLGGQAPAADLTGFWEATYVSEPGYGPKLPWHFQPEIPTLLYLRVIGDEISGTAIVGPWPGRADISDGKIEGGRFFFKLTGRLLAPSGLYPVMQIEGTLRGGEIAYTSVWDDYRAEMEGQRLEE